MVKGIIFDIGGVLAYDIEEYLFYFDNCAIVEKYHLDAEKVKEVAAKLWNKYAHTRQDLEESWQELEQEHWNEFKSLTGLVAPNAELIELSEKYVRPVPGMNDLLEWLQSEKYDLLICSNNIEFLFQRQKRLTGFGKYFEKRKIILSNHYGEPKDHESRNMFNALEKQMDFSKENYLFVDDRQKNIKAALQFGIVPLLFPPEASYGHTYVKEIIKKMNSL